MTGKCDDNYSIDLNGLSFFFKKCILLFLLLSSRHMGKRNLPTTPKILGRQEWSVLSSCPEEES